MFGPRIPLRRTVCFDEEERRDRRQVRDVQRRRERDNPEPGHLAHPPFAERPVEDDAGENLRGDRDRQIGGHPRDLAVGPEALQKRLTEKPRRMWAHERDGIHTERSDRRNPSSCGWLSHSRRD